MPSYAQLLSCARSFLLENERPGTVFTLIQDGEVVLDTAVGHADLQQTVPLQPEARFPIYSVTKTWLATALLLLVQEDRLDLDAPLQPHFPDLPLQDITVRQVLTHTSGLPDYGALPAYKADLLQDPLHPWTQQQYLQLIEQQGLNPEQGFHYSNVGYLLLKLLLEQLEGETMARVLHQRLFAPLGLQHTTVAENLSDMALLTPGFSGFWSGGQPLQDVRAFYHPGWVAHGVVLSTARETALLLDALFSGQLLPPLLMGQMLEGVVVAEQHPIFQVPGYGLGLMVDALQHQVMGHGGGGPGYSIGALHFPDRLGHSLTCVAMVNGDLGSVGLDLAHGLASLL